MLYVTVGCRCLIALVFATSAVTKLRSRAAFAAFADWLARLSVVPMRGRTVAATVAGTEAAIVVLVGLPWTVLPGFLLAAVLMAAFTVGTYLVARSELNEPCQCFGVSAVPLGMRHVIRNLALCAIAATGAAVSVAHTGRGRPADVAASVGVALAAGMFVVFFDDLAALFAPASVPAASQQ